MCECCSEIKHDLANNREAHAHTSFVAALLDTKHAANPAFSINTVCRVVNLALSMTLALALPIQVEQSSKQKLASLVSLPPGSVTTVQTAHVCIGAVRMQLGVHSFSATLAFRTRLGHA